MSAARNGFRAYIIVFPEFKTSSTRITFSMQLLSGIDILISLRVWLCLSSWTSISFTSKGAIFFSAAVKSSGNLEARRFNSCYNDGRLLCVVFVNLICNAINTLFTLFVGQKCCMQKVPYGVKLLNSGFYPTGLVKYFLVIGFSKITDGDTKLGACVCKFILSQVNSDMRNSAFLYFEKTRSPSRSSDFFTGLVFFINVSGTSK